MVVFGGDVWVEEVCVECNEGLVEYIGCVLVVVVGKGDVVFDVVVVLCKVDIIVSFVCFVVYVMGLVYGLLLDCWLL